MKTSSCSYLGVKEAKGYQCDENFGTEKIVKISGNRSPDLTLAVDRREVSVHILHDSFCVKRGFSKMTLPFNIQVDQFSSRSDGNVPTAWEREASSIHLRCHTRRNPVLDARGQLKFTTWVVQATNTASRSTVFLQAVEAYRQDGNLYSDAPQLVPYFHINAVSRGDQVFDSEFAQSIGKTVFQTLGWCIVNFENIPPERLMRMQTF